MRYDRIPSCVYLEPEIACIGLTEAQAREKYGDGLKIGRFNMAANGKSLIAGDTDGLFKVIVAADTGEILGAHLYGQHVTDMIGEISAAMAAEGTAEELIHAIHPHSHGQRGPGRGFYGRLERTGHQFPVTGRILCLGDSLTYGFGLPRDWSGRRCAPPRPGRSCWAGASTATPPAVCWPSCPICWSGSTRTRSS